MFILLSGISGAGKTTLINEVLTKSDFFEYPKCITTRSKRETDNDSMYIYVTNQEFIDYVYKNKLLEYQEYRGNYYGTLLENYNEISQKKHIAITEMGYDGINTVRSKIDDAINIFIDIDINLIINRLQTRGEDINTIQHRLKEIDREKMMLKDICDYMISNNGTIDEMTESFNKTLKYIRRHL